MIIFEAGTGLLREAYAPFDQLLSLSMCHAGSSKSIDGGLVRSGGRNLSACFEISHMRPNDRSRIVNEQPRRPELGVQLVTLDLQLRRQAAVQYNRTAGEGIGQSDHQPNLATQVGVVLVAELQPVPSKSKIEPRCSVGADGDEPLPDRYQLVAQLVWTAVGGR